MITVTAQRLIERPEYQLLSQEVQLHGFNRLTPRAARAALEIAFGNDTSGSVWCETYGYRVYPDSARKVWSE